MRAALPALLLLAACVSGPRPVPAGATAAERLAHCEASVLGAKKATASFLIDATGQNPAHFTGTLELHGGNALKLAAEGTFKGEPVFIDLDSRDPEGTSRTVTKGPSASGHRDPPASAMGEAVGLGLVRMGLLHNLAVLTADEPVDHASGGVREWVKPTNVKDGPIDSFGGETCHRVEFTIEVNAAPRGEASVCIADATGLPLHRTQTVRFEAGTMSVTETLTWKFK